jgi:phosphomannomutase/phosphoglucomutase
VTVLNPFIFRAYDVRGKVGIDITPEVFDPVGRAFGTLVRRRGGRTVALGMDNRVSSRALKDAFGAGMLSTGLDVVDIGVNHTPLLYFATAHWKLDGGATITGSHNPVSDNGVKMVHAGAAPLTESEIQGLLATIKSGDFERGVGTRATRDPRDEYWDAITSRVKLGRRLKVVVDAGNGIAGVFAPELLRRLGCEVVELYCESDGTFPNHLPDPEMEENMRDLVARTVEVGADVGVAYDGDADRVGIVDEKGRRHEADLLLALLARDLLTRHPGAQIVFDVKSSQVLVDDITKHGGQPIMWKTGHSHLKRKMREDGILLGGEVSGHMFFGEDWYGVDDGILAS